MYVYRFLFWYSAVFEYNDISNIMNFFYVLLTVHLGIFIAVINQLHAQN